MASVKQDNLEQEDKNKPTVEPTSVATGGGASTQAAGVPASTSNFRPQDQRKGSGQATNIQKYLQANQGAGQKIAGDIQEKGRTQAEKIGENVARSKQLYNQRADQLRRNISGAEDAGKQVFQQAGQNQVQDQQIAQAQQLASGQLGSLAGQLGTSTAGLAGRTQAIQNLANQVGTEQGRFQALSDVYKQGGRQYGAGQQKLDQLLLQRGGAERLQDQLGNIAQQAQQQVSGLENEVAAVKGDITRDAALRQEALRNLITTGSSAGELEGVLQQRGLQDIAAGAEERAMAEEARRAQERENYETLAAKLSRGEALTDEEYNLAQGLGVERGTKTYGAFGPDSKYIDDTFGAETLGQFGKSDIDYRDVVNRQEVDRYNALARIINQDPNSFATEAGTLDESFVGNDKLKRIIEGAKADFNTRAANTVLTGTGTGHRSTGKSLLGQVKHFTGEAAEAQNIADYLAGEEAKREVRVGTNARGFIDSVGADITDALTGMIGKGDVAGKKREQTYKQQAQAEAEQRAKEDLQRKIQEYLKQNKYDETF